MVGVNTFMSIMLICVISNVRSWSVCLRSCRLGFDSKSGKTNGFEICTSQLLFVIINIQEKMWRTSQQVYVLRRWARHLMGFLHLGVVDGWPGTPK